MEYLGYPPIKASGNTTSWELSRVLARVVRVFNLVRVSERVGLVLVWITEMVRVRGIMHYWVCVGLRCRMYRVICLVVWRCLHEVHKPDFSICPCGLVATRLAFDIESERFLVIQSSTPFQVHFT